MLKLHVEDKEEDAGQKGYEPNGDPIVASIIVLVENAVEALASNVHIAFVYDGAEYHHREDLKWRG